MASGRLQKLDSFNLRVDPELKAAFLAAAESSDRPAAQVLREFMRGYVDKSRGAESYATRAAEDSRRVAEAESDPSSDAAALQRDLDANFDDLMREEPDC